VSPAFATNASLRGGLRKISPQGERAPPPFPPTSHPRPSPSRSRPYGSAPVLRTGVKASSICPQSRSALTGKTTHYVTSRELARWLVESGVAMIDQLARVTVTPELRGALAAIRG
jgi:hypothetical protein